MFGSSIEKGDQLKSVVIELKKQKIGETEDEIVNGTLLQEFKLPFAKRGSETIEMAL